MKQIQYLKKSDQVECRMIRKLGSGGSAEVWMIRSVEDPKLYACKISRQKEWIRKEAELLSQISFPGFPRFEDYLEDGETGFLVMEYIEGDTMEEYLRRRKHFSERESARMLTEIGIMLQYLHRFGKGIAYRDLKPSNIMIQPDGKIRLLDLGAAAIGLNWAAGTPGYAAPEQLSTKKGAAQETSEDIYSFGVLMRYMRSGEDPFREGSGSRKSRRLSVGKICGLEQIQERCLREVPQERFPDMEEVVFALNRYRNSALGERIFREGIRRITGRKPHSIRYEKNVWVSDYKEL